MENTHWIFFLSSFLVSKLCLVAKKMEEKKRNYEMALLSLRRTNQLDKGV